MSVHTISKQSGETPLFALERLRAQHPELADQSLTYAGRLDPLATGLLIILSGGSIDRKQEFLSMQKEYECEILLGCATDTGDVLGLVTDAQVNESISESSVQEILPQFVGTQLQAYPAYSSKAVDGKPLWLHTREGSEVAPPEHEIAIDSIEFLGMRTVSSVELLKDIQTRITSVSGDFRQAEITACWKNLLNKSQQVFQLIKIRAVVSSGTYMRVLAEDIGRVLGCPALAFTIHRTRIGDYILS